jgi:hypothetical protein
MTSRFNTTVGFPGRFGNHFIRNFYASFLAESGDLAFTYGYFDDLRRLGIPLFTSGKKRYDKNVIITDENSMDYFGKPVDFNIDIWDTYIQNHEFATYLYKYLRQQHVMESIMRANIFKERYNSNNDVYVHVRLDDAEPWTPGISYYENAIEATGATSGFISSDAVNHPTVQKLAEKYGFKIIMNDIVETFMLASTCKYLVLSHGSFSWSIGSISFFSEKVFIPPHRYMTIVTKKSKWVGDIFRMPNWQTIEP